MYSSYRQDISASFFISGRCRYLHLKPLLADSDISLINRVSLVFAYDFCFASAVLHGCVMTSRHSVWIILKFCLFFFAVFSIDYNDELDTLVSGSADLTVKVWSLSSGTCVNTLTGHTEWVTKVRLLTSVHSAMLWLEMHDIPVKILPTIIFSVPVMIAIKLSRAGRYIERDWLLRNIVLRIADESPSIMNAICPSLSVNYGSVY